MVRLVDREESHATAQCRSENDGIGVIHVIATEQATIRRNIVEPFYMNAE